ncbi:MAG: DUF362 domain-containing protein [Rhodospirillales bacterium]
MNRRRFLELTAAAATAASAQQKTETAIASATRDVTPRVAIVLSSFTGGEDHDGTKYGGLADPQPVTADLTAAQIDAMVRKAIELGVTAQGGLADLIAEDEWVVIKPNIVACHGLGPEDNDGGAHHRYIRGTVTDLRIVQSLIAFLVEHKCGARITIAEGSGEWLPKERSKSAVDGWTSDWGGEFGGLSYRKMVDEFAKKHPAIQFDIVDLNFDGTVEMPAPADPERTYHVPKTIQQCDRLISVCPLKTHAGTGISAAMKNYIGIAPGSHYGFPKDALHKLGPLEQTIVDLFSIHPADYAIAGGCWGIGGKGPFHPGGVSVHHNLILAGASAVAVDAVAAAIMGFKPEEVKYFAIAERRGFGGSDTDLIWTRGNEIEQARRDFRNP